MHVKSLVGLSRLFRAILSTRREVRSQMRFAARSQGVGGYVDGHMGVWYCRYAEVSECPCRDLFNQLRARNCSAVDSTTYLVISSTKVTKDHIRRMA